MTGLEDRLSTGGHAYMIARKLLGLANIEDRHMRTNLWDKPSGQSYRACF